ncbi:hypothetical protein J6590_060177 [Homalodisca vitripennis]|nr:hypothetical protein J6590_060177 [Homalodisca vitripennis]
MIWGPRSRNTEPRYLFKNNGCVLYVAKAAKYRDDQSKRQIMSHNHDTEADTCSRVYRDRRLLQWCPRHLPDNLIPPNLSNNFAFSRVLECQVMVTSTGSTRRPRRKDSL